MKPYRYNDGLGNLTTGNPLFPGLGLVLAPPTPVEELHESALGYRSYK